MYHHCLALAFDHDELPHRVLFRLDFNTSGLEFEEDTGVHRTLENASKEIYNWVATTEFQKSFPEGGIPVSQIQEALMKVENNRYCVLQFNCQTFCKSIYQDLDLDYKKMSIRLPTRFTTEEQEAWLDSPEGVGTHPPAFIFQGKLHHSSDLLRIRVPLSTPPTEGDEKEPPTRTRSNTVQRLDELWETREDLAQSIQDMTNALPDLKGDDRRASEERIRQRTTELDRCRFQQRPVLFQAAWGTFRVRRKFQCVWREGVAYRRTREFELVDRTFKGPTNGELVDAVAVEKDWIQVQRDRKTYFLPRIDPNNPKRELFQEIKIEIPEMKTRDSGDGVPDKR